MLYNGCLIRVSYIFWLLQKKYIGRVCYVEQRWNRVTTADPDDPVTRIGKLWNTLRNHVNNTFQVPSNVYSQ